MNGRGLSRREREIADISHRQGNATVAKIKAAMADPPRGRDVFLRGRHRS